MKKFETKQLVNKPENPFQNYDVAKKTLKTNQNFSHSLRKRRHYKEICYKLIDSGQNRMPEKFVPGIFFS